MHLSVAFSFSSSVTLTLLNCVLIQYFWLYTRVTCAFVLLGWHFWLLWCLSALRTATVLVTTARVSLWLLIRPHPLLTLAIFASSFFLAACRTSRLCRELSKSTIFLPRLAIFACSTACTMLFHESVGWWRCCNSKGSQGKWTHQLQLNSSDTMLILYRLLGRASLPRKGVWKVGFA